MRRSAICAARASRRTARLPRGSREETKDPIAYRLLVLITELQVRQSERERLQKMERHELGNALSIAQANLEAMVDGVLEITPERLHGIRESLRSAGALLVDIKGLK